MEFIIKDRKQRGKQEEKRLERAVKEMKEVGRQELEEAAFKKGQGRPLWGNDACAGPRRVRTRGPSKQQEEKGWKVHLASEEGERFWARCGLETPYLIHYSHKSNGNCSRQLIGNLLWMRKSANYNKIPKKSFPDRRSASFSPSQWNPKVQVAEAESH